METLAIDLLVHLSSFLFGFGVACALLRTRPRLWSIAVGYPLGLGLATWLLFLESVAGVGLSRTVILVNLLLMAGAGTALLTTQKSLSPSPVPLAGGPPRRRGSLRRVLLIGSLAVILISAITAFAVAISYSAWDGMAIWSVKGYGIALEGSVLGARIWGAFGLDYPLNIPMMAAVFSAIDGDTLPGSKMAFPFLLASMVMAVYLFLRRRGMGTTLALSGALLLPATPIIFEHGTNGYSNLPLASYLTIGILCAVDGFRDRDRGRLLVSGLFFGFAAWTRPEGMLVAPAMMAAVALTCRRTFPGVRSTAAWSLAFGLILGGWLTFAWRHSDGGLMASTAQSAAAAIGRGEFHLSAPYVIARFMGHQLLTPSDWGILLPLWVVLFAVRWRSMAQDEEARSIAVSALVVAALMVGHFYSTAFLGTLEEWLTTSGNRMFLPAGILLTVSLLCLVPSPGGGPSPANPPPA